MAECQGAPRLDDGPKVFLSSPIFDRKLQRKHPSAFDPAQYKSGYNMIRWHNQQPFIVPINFQ